MVKSASFWVNARIPKLNSRWSLSKIQSLEGTMLTLKIQNETRLVAKPVDSTQLRGQICDGEEI